MDRLLPLMQAVDPLFPIGAYTLSNGLETYTQKGLVRDEGTLLAYLKAQLHILPYGDLGIAARAALDGDFDLLDGICGAMKAPYEIRRGSERLCQHFLKAQSALSEQPLLRAYWEAIQGGRCDGHYPVALGLFIRSLGAPLVPSLQMVGYSLLSAMVNHAVKLIPLRQMDGQSALYAAVQGIPAAVHRALCVSTEALGVSGCGFDLRAMQHETLPGRLYIS